MEKRLKNYLHFWEEKNIDRYTIEERRKMAQELLIQIQFFQHERLVHLIVTITFAILTMLAVLGFLALAQNGGFALLFLVILLLVLLVPYVRHYYILENGVQKLYTYYDKLVDTDR